MSVFDGVTVNRLNGGLGRRNPSDDGVVLLVVHNAVAASGLAVNTVRKVLSVAEAEGIGVDASYDDTNDILAHYHISEFFRINPDGTLYVILANSSFTTAMLKSAIRENTDIRAIGIARNDATPVGNFSTYVGGYQTLVDELVSEHIRIDAVFLEGNEIELEDNPISGYDDLRQLNARNVSVVCFQDLMIRSIKAEYEGHAAIGTVLGSFSVRSVNENLGSVDIARKPSRYRGNATFSLTDLGTGRLLSVCLQNGQNVSDLDRNTQKSLDEKGYLFAGSYSGLAGVYLSNAPTCVELADDFAYVENNRVFNKAARLIRTALLPRVKGNLLKNPDTGFLRDTAVKELEQLARKALQTMESAGECSGVDVYINPEQTINQTTPLVVKAQILANDILFDISVDLGLTQKIEQ